MVRDYAPATACGTVLFHARGDPTNPQGREAITSGLPVIRGTAPTTMAGTSSIIDSLTAPGSGWRMEDGESQRYMKCPTLAQMLFG